MIGVANPDLKLFPGMTANVKILIDRAYGRAEDPQRRAALSPGDRTPRDAAAATAAAAQRQARADSRRSGCWTQQGQAPAACT